MATATVFNVNMSSANTEYSLVLPGNTKRVLIKTRTGADDLKLGYAPNTSGTVYITIPATSTKVMDGEELRNCLSELTLYFQSPTPDIVEIETWQ